MLLGALAHHPVGEVERVIDLIEHDQARRAKLREQRVGARNVREVQRREELGDPAVLPEARGDLDARPAQLALAELRDHAIGALDPDLEHIRGE